MGKEKPPQLNKKEAILRAAGKKEKRILGALKKLKEKFGGITTEEELSQFKNASMELLRREFPETKQNGSNIFQEIKEMRDSGEISEKEFEVYIETFLASLPLGEKEPIQ